jgi:drug/metabolite transporter (DMT)-like permease
MWIVYALVASIVWGLDYALAERIFHKKIAPATLLAIEMFIGGAVFFLVSAAGSLKSDIGILVENRAALWLMVSAVVGFIIANLFIALSVQAKNATLAGLIEISYPIFIAIFSLILFKENQVTPSIIVGGTMIFMGVTVIYLYN